MVKNTFLPFSMFLISRRTIFALFDYTGMIYPCSNTIPWLRSCDQLSNDVICNYFEIAIIFEIMNMCTFL